MAWESFNKLSPAELERLACLSEECGECIQIIGKIIRHGYNLKDPTKTNSPDNRTLLEKEIGDIQGAVFRMIARNDIDEKRIKARAIKRLESQQYLHHN